MAEAPEPHLHCPRGVSGIPEWVLEDEGWGIGMQDYQHPETKARQVPQTAEEEGACWPLTLLAGEGLGSGKNRASFMQLEAARNLII